MSQVYVGAYTDKKGKVRPITRRVGRVKGARKSKRYHARDFGDNPKIRHSHGEQKQVNLQQPWEIRHAIKTGKLKPVPK